MPDIERSVTDTEADYMVRLEAEVERLQEELRRAEGRIEQRYANDQVRQMRRTGYCPCCGAEA